MKQRKIYIVFTLAIFLSVFGSLVLAAENEEPISLAQAIQSALPEVFGTATGFAAVGGFGAAVPPGVEIPGVVSSRDITLTGITPTTGGGTPPTPPPIDPRSGVQPPPPPIDPRSGVRPPSDSN